MRHFLSFSFGCALLVGCAAQTNSPSGKSFLVVTQDAEARAQYEAKGRDYMIATQGKAASLAAKEVFEAGGNSIDAAVAASFVISVERPQSTGLGGGGFWLFREGKTKKVYAVDFRERAPLAATRDMYLNDKHELIPKLSLNGIRSVATPGLVAGVLEVHKRFGRLPREKVMAPAIRLAEEGLIVYPRLAAALASRQEVLRQYPATAKIFLKADGSPYQVGERIIQRDLATSLRLIAREGPRAFYKGKLRDAILATSAKQGGLLTRKDFEKYRVKWREPVEGEFHGYQLFSMPPPSSGGVHVLEVLNILSKYPLKEWGFLSPPAIHHTAAALQLAFADRSLFPGDPDFVKVPTRELISKRYAEVLRSKIKEDKATASQEIKPGPLPKPESLETTHFSLLDKEGNMVASTQTINYLFGSGVVAEGTGILLNDEMDDFSVKTGTPNVFGAVGGDANAIAPGKTPLSSMSPTLVLKQGEPVLAVGAPGGTRIISCVAETLLNYLAYGLPLYESVATLRFHHQWLPDQLDIDLPGPGSSAVGQLERMGYKVRVADDAVSCRVEAVAREGELFHGVADPRDLGAALGR